MIKSSANASLNRAWLLAGLLLGLFPPAATAMVDVEGHASSLRFSFIASGFLFLLVAGLGYWALVQYYRQRVANAVTAQDKISTRLPAVLFGLLYVGIVAAWGAILMGSIFSSCR